MKELATMWRSTRMIVLTALAAACYVAALLPFKVAVLLPGLTEIRPGAAIPVLLSFLFGPAAAFGAGFGNVIADMLGGMFGPGSLAGFAGNFLYGYVPYVLWRAVRGDAAPGERGRSDWILVALIAVVSCVTIAVVIGWGADLLGLAPFAALGNIILLNNLAATLLLSVPLLALTYKRLDNAGLTWNRVMDGGGTAPRFARAGVVIVVAAAVGGLVAGEIISLSMLGVDFGAAGFAGERGTVAIGAGLSPFIAALLFGCALL
ncbi:MAG: QueT transporter family protein [Deltaproteobacteria bacterium]|nr:QueT transporter family protein [Deltaproteobacteria bacterium]